MIRSTTRTASKVHRCGCGRLVAPGDRYVEQVASPHHGDLENPGWWRLAECMPCAIRYGRGEAA